TKGSTCRSEPGSKIRSDGARRRRSSKVADGIRKLPVRKWVLAPTSRWDASGGCSSQAARCTTSSSAGARQPRRAAVAWRERREEEVVRIRHEGALEIGRDRNCSPALPHQRQPRGLGGADHRVHVPRPQLKPGGAAILDAHPKRSALDSLELDELDP